MSAPSDSRRDTGRYLVVLPAYNEKETIATVLQETRDAFSFADMIVVDDGSEDETASIAEAAGTMVIRHPFNLGYGAALQTGFRFAVRRGYDFVVTMDADGQHIPSSIHNLVAAMAGDRADIVIGSRFINGGYDAGLARRMGIWLFSLVARAYTGINITDPTSGFQLLNRSVFSFLAEGDNYPLDYPDVNIIMALHKRRFRIVETPVAMVPSKTGQSMHSGLSPLFYVIKMWLAIIMVLVRGRGK